MKRSKHEDRTTRLEEFYNSLNIKRKSFCEATGIDYAFLSQLLNGHSTVTANVVDRIVQAYPQVNGSWILHGTGEMILKPESQTTNKQNVPPDHSRAITIDSLTDIILNMQNQISTHEVEIEELKSRLAELEHIDR